MSEYTFKKHKFESFGSWWTVPKIAKGLSSEKRNLLMRSEGFVSLSRFSENVDLLMEKFNAIRTEDSGLASNMRNSFFLMNEPFLGKQIAPIVFVYDRYENSFRDELKSRIKSSVEKLFPKASPIMVSLFTSMVYKTNTLEEYGFYRAVALNEFLEHAENETTYGEYTSNNHENILSQVFEMSVAEYEHTKKLFEVYENHNHLVSYRSVSHSVNEEIFKSFKKKDILLSLSKENISDFSKFNLDYSKSLVAAEESFKTGIIADVPKNIIGSLTKALYKSAAKNMDFADSGVSLTFFNSSYTNFVNAFANNTRSHGSFSVSYTKSFVSKQRIADILLEIAEEITPFDLIGVLFSMGSSNAAFRSSTSEKSTEIVLAGLKGEDPVGFVKFVADLVFVHNMGIATYGEWISLLKEGIVDYSIGADFLIPIMSKREVTLRPRINSNHELMRKKIGKYLYYKDDEEEKE